jgi:3',5'-cyclic AMP phosphodiesterase CpdA
MIGLAMSTITLAHVSDLHLPFEPVLSPLQRLSKRQLSSWAWRRRGALHRTEILEALKADLRVQGADHIVVTGDTANFSLPEEFRRAAIWLAALAPAAEISLVPGNHDALVPVTAEQGLGRLAAFTRAESGWPFVHRVGPLSLIGVNSARPTAPLLARGRIGAGQLSRLATVLAAERAAGRVRVVLLHHPVAPGAVRWRKALADRAALCEVLRREGAELVLHGHARDARFDAVAGPHAPIPCLCVPSSSALPNPRDEGARWHRLTLNCSGGSGVADVEVRLWSVAAQAFVPGGGYRLRLPRPQAAMPASPHALHG